jgi:hypothetical protein
VLARRSHPRSIGRYEIGNCRLVCSGTLRLGELRQAEIDNFGSAIFGEEEVFRFEIAVDDSRTVRSRQATGDLYSQVQHVMQRHRAPTETIAQGLALQQFRNSVRRALVLAYKSESGTRAIPYLITLCSLSISTVFSIGRASTVCPLLVIVVALNKELYTASSVASIVA